MKNSKGFLAGILMAVLAALPLGMGLASVENHTESDENYKMSYPIVYVESNQEAQDRINSDKRKWILEDHKEWRPNVYGQCKSWLARMSKSYFRNSSSGI